MLQNLLFYRGLVQHCLPWLLEEHAAKARKGPRTHNVSCTQQQESMPGVQIAVHRQVLQLAPNKQD